MTHVNNARYFVAGVFPNGFEIGAEQNAPGCVEGLAVRAAGSKASVWHECRIAHSKKHPEKVSEAARATRVLDVALPLLHPGGVCPLVAVFNQGRATSRID